MERKKERSRWQLIPHRRRRMTYTCTRIGRSQWYKELAQGKAKEIKAMTGMFTPGRKSDLPQWMEKFEWACETAGLSDDQKASVIGALLGEGAFRVYRDIPDDQRCDWTAIKDTLLRIYPKTKPSLHQSRAKWDSLPLKTFTTFEKLAGKIQQYAHLAHPGFPKMT